MPKQEQKIANDQGIERMLSYAKELMESKIRRRLHHGTWVGLSLTDLYWKMIAEIRELDVEFRSFIKGEETGFLEKIEDEVVGVMNYGAMMLDVIRDLRKAGSHNGR